MYYLYEDAVQTGFANETVEGLFADIDANRRDDFFPFDGFKTVITVFDKTAWDEEELDDDAAPRGLNPDDHVIEAIFTDDIRYANIGDFDIERINAFFEDILPHRGFRIVEE